MMAGFAVLPTIRDMKSIMALQRSMLDYAHLAPILSLSKNIPHLTLVQGDYHATVNFDGVCASLKDQWDRLGLARMSYQAIRAEKPSWLFLTIKKNPQLAGLHHLAFTLSAPHLIPPASKGGRKPGYSKAHWTNYLKWGYRYVGDCFLPHVTIGKVISEQTSLSLRVLRRMFDGFNREGTYFNPHAIVAYRMGEFGSCLETLASKPI